jgi:parvulin-like peptidyl-prolyl isomerase
MLNFNKTSSDNNKAPKTKILKARRRAIVISSAVVFLILVIVFVSIYANAAPFRSIVIAVDDTTINMDYFLRRMKQTGADSMVMLEALTNEQLIKIKAPEYDVEVSPEDIDRELRRIAAGESGTISESEFKEWYRQLHNDFDFSDEEYREMVATRLLAVGIQRQFAARVPTVAEQVYLYMAALDDGEVTQLIQAEQAGDDMGTLTEEMWLGKESEEAIEEIGWMPRGLISAKFDEATFSLPIGVVGGPVARVNEDSTDALEVFYYLIKTSEKTDSREIKDTHLRVLRAKTLDNWLLEEIKLHEVEWYGLQNGFDTETISWINWQLSRD